MYSTRPADRNKLGDPGSWDRELCARSWVVQHTRVPPPLRQSLVAMCALTTARAMWQANLRYGVTMCQSAFGMTLAQAVDGADAALVRPCADCRARV